MNCRLCDENKNQKALWIVQATYWNVHVCWFQHALGTLGIILKRHVESFTELTPEEIKELGELLQKYQTKLQHKFQPDWFNIQMNGNWHHHLHFLLLPRYEKSRQFDGKSYEDESYGQPIIYTKIEEPDETRSKLTDLLG